MRYFLIFTAVTISTAVGILVIKSLVEMALYSQPFLLRAAKNIYAFIADVVVMTVSLPLCEKLRSSVIKIFPEEFTA